MNKKIVLINDISGIGKCSLMASIPIFSHFEIEPSPIVTAILSNHTGYDKFSFFDFTPYMESYIKVWEEDRRKFDCVYSGFLGSENQIEIVKKFIKKHRESLIVIDPVMGDDGKVYTTYTRKMCDKIKDLIRYADVVTPNLTEAKILTNRDLKMNITEEEGKIICKEISDLGPNVVILTGVIENGEIKNLAYKRDEEKFFVAKGKYYPYSFSGTGDIFTSLITSLILKRVTLEKTLSIATDTMIKAVEESIKEEGFDTREGVKFEKVIKDVIYE